MSDDLMRRLRHDEKAFGDEICGEAADEIDRLCEENERLREAWMMEKQLGVRVFEKMCELAKALQRIARHPTGGVGCNPVVFVEEARAALAEKGEK